MNVDQTFSVAYRFPVLFTREAFDPGNLTLAGLLPRNRGRHRVLPLVDSGLFDCQPGLAGQMTAYARCHADVMEFVVPPQRIPGGEACKDGTVEVAKLQATIAQHRLCRHSFVLAVGGGALLDMAGFASATAHRGVRLLRMPSTVLAQNDAGVGVKNGVNAFGRKNFLGTFSPPYAVLNDFKLLDSLSPRDRRAGLAEAVKVAVIADGDFFSFLWRARAALAAFEPEVMEQAISRCALLHLEHVRTAGDPFEFGSARPLDFGHWSAHRLEALTGGEVRHGEAVAAGIALDTLYARRVGCLAEGEAAMILTLLEEVGFSLHHPAFGEMDVAAALEEFREHLGGNLTLMLPVGLGRKAEVNFVDVPLMERCLEELAIREHQRSGIVATPEAVAAAGGR